MKKFLGMIGAFAVAATLMAVTPVRAQNSDDNAQQTQTQGRGHMRRARGEQHPAIMRAIRQLQNTKMILQRQAADDFDGHKAKAIQEIDEALNQLHQALQADRK
jgi:hypothetical protein